MLLCPTFLPILAWANRRLSPALLYLCRIPNIDFIDRGKNGVVKIGE
jgi:hypothetical protein